MASLGFAQWATGVRNRMADDPGRADFKDQVQRQGHDFLDEYLDNVLNTPRSENAIEFAKTPGRNETSSKRTRAVNASAQKIKPIVPLSLTDEPAYKENISTLSPPAKQLQLKGTSRFQNALFTASETSTDDTSRTDDSISRNSTSRDAFSRSKRECPTKTAKPEQGPTGPAPVTLATESAPASASEPKPAPVPAIPTSQPIPPPKPMSTAAPAPASRSKSQSRTRPAQPQPAQTRLANPARGLGGAFTGPSLKDSENSAPPVRRVMLPPPVIAVHTNSLVPISANVSSDVVVAANKAEATRFFDHKKKDSENLSPPVRRVMLPPPVLAVHTNSHVPISTNVSSDVVAAANKAEARRFFANRKPAPPRVAPRTTQPVPRTETQSTIATEVESVFDTQGRTRSHWSQSTNQSIFGTSEGDPLGRDDELGVAVDAEGEVHEEVEEGTKPSDRTCFVVPSAAQTRSVAKKGPVKSIQLAAAAAKKAAEEQDRKVTRMKDMEERRQAAALRKAGEHKAKFSELEHKRKESEELATPKSVKPLVVVKKPQEDPHEKRKAEAGKELVKTEKPVFKDTATTQSRIVKPTPGSSALIFQPPQLKSAIKPTTNPFAPPPSATKTIRHLGSSSSLKSIGGSISKKAKASTSDAPGQAQLKAAQKKLEAQYEHIDLPQINTDSDSDSEDGNCDKGWPDWAQPDELIKALKAQETYNPAVIFGPIQPLKMDDLFKTGHARFRNRTSSANWAGTDGVTREEEIEYARRMGYKD